MFDVVNLGEMVLMYKAYKFRLYPNNEQRILIHKTFGCTRFVYNYFLDKCKSNGYIKAHDMCNTLKEIYSEYPFLKEVNPSSLRCTIFNLEDSYKNYFFKRGNYPTFKNRYSKQSYRSSCIRSTYKGKDYSIIELDLINHKIKLPKLGLIDIRGYRHLEVINGNIINVTIEKEHTNKYYVSVIVNEIDTVLPKAEPNSIVGIDLGIKDLVVTSDGEKYHNPKELKRREKQLKRLQRKLSRQVRNSNNYYKTKVRIARVHSKIKNSRKYNMINIVNKIIREHDIIVSEKLKVKEMSSNHNLAKNILDASFGKICSLLEWKCKLQGKYYYQVDSYFPSSKKCSHCDNITDKTNDLSVRNWTCEVCGAENDRDIGASINIMFEGLRLHYQR